MRFLNVLSPTLPIPVSATVAIASSSAWSATVWASASRSWSIRASLQPSIRRCATSARSISSPISGSAGGAGGAGSGVICMGRVLLFLCRCDTSSLMEAQFFNRDIAHLVLLNLARYGQRKFIHESDVARDLVMRDLATAEVAELLGASALALLELDPGHDLLAIFQ